MTTIKFFTTKREGKVALWVQREGDSAWNIWDLKQKEATPEVLEAVHRAFEMGWRFCEIEHRDLDDPDVVRQWEVK